MRPSTLTSWIAILLSVLFGLAIFWAVEWSSLDLWLQDHLYNWDTHAWRVGRDSFWPKLIFYNGIKWVLGGAGLTALGLFIASFRKRRFRSQRWAFLYFFLCLALIPLTISTMKNYTNVYCPWDIQRYGGDQPYVKAIDPYPPDYVQRGRAPQCFPGGHSSGGFALLSLVFLATTRRSRTIFLAGALGMGWTMGIYQMLKGAHYFSHILTTMILSWFFCLLIFKAMEKCCSRPNH
jgi:membrane-associated PAP2 superfamily phosphatase